MKTRLSVVFLLIVLTPLAILGWLGARVARSEREMVGHRFGAILQDRLRDIAADAAEVLAQRERELLSLPSPAARPAVELRESVRHSGVVRQYFVLDEEGELAYPAPSGIVSGALTAGEREFLERTRLIWANGEIPSWRADATPAAKSKKTLPPAKGWHVWYWGEGINLILWWRDASGVIVGAELNVVRLKADIIGALPGTDSVAPGQTAVRIVLADSTGAPIYQWGTYEPGEAERARASIELSPPLSAWRLEYYAPANAVGAAFGRSVTFNLLSGLAVLGLAVLGLAVYYYRESARTMREAAQRVSFVNQVSHELKTPLTSIRMYAEMLEDEVDETEAKARRHLEVIESESQRLSGLIANVLTFSRKQRSALKLHTAPGNVDEALSNVIEHFRQPLRAKGIEVEFHGEAGQTAEFDRDALGQIVGNLLGNVEKYALRASRVTLASRQDGNTIWITVADDGPGIPLKERERIFEAFYRVSDKLTDGVAGTGIGLAIARELARLHGGDLTLEPSARGACFRLRIHTPGGEPA